MGSLILIRHGQASYGAADYDRLSPLGEQQARALGVATSSETAGLDELDAVYSGPLRRQRDTRTLMLASAAHPITDGGVLDEFAEYPAFELLAAELPALIEEEPAMEPLRNGPMNPMLLDRAFWMLLTRWSRGELRPDGIEAIDDFVARIKRGLTKIFTAHVGSGQRVAIVTSGGPISIAVMLALSTPAERAISLGRSIRNASVSTFRWRSRGFAWQADDFSLVSLNHVDALPPTHHTHR